jgi:cyclohexyl-isocyanide hydratase
MHLVMLAFPRLTQLDLTGPFEVFARNPEIDISIVWKVKDPVLDASGFAISPTAIYEDAPQADILFVPGGPGQLDLMDDEETLAFLRRQAEGARFVTSVCTGSLVLAAAGLLTGYRATCHWGVIEQLAMFGVTPTRNRVVIDRNRVTGAGVSAGLDFALLLTAELFGVRRAECVQLSMEYDPQPPVGAGAPGKANFGVVTELRDAMAGLTKAREVAAQKAAAKLRERE